MLPVRMLRQTLSVSIASIATQQVAIAVLGHPFRAPQVTFPSSARARGLGRGIDVQHQPRYPGPIGAFGFGIKKPKVGDEMVLVVGSQGLGVRSKIGDRRIERRLGHRQSASFPRFLIEPPIRREIYSAIAIHISWWTATSPRLCSKASSRSGGKAAARRGRTLPIVEDTPW